MQPKLSSDVVQRVQMGPEGADFWHLQIFKSKVVEPVDNAGSTVFRVLKERAVLAGLSVCLAKYREHSSTAG